MKLKARIIALLILLAGFAFGQDLIIKKDSTEIYCKIVYVNLKSLFYLLPNNVNEIKIDKSEVQKYVFDWNQVIAPAPKPVIKVSESKTVALEPAKLSLIALVGVSMPSGDYSSIDANNNQAGFAMNGWYFETGLAVSLHKLIRLNITYAMQSNPFNGSAYDADFKTLNPGATLSTIAGNYQMNGFFGGLSLYFPLSEEQKVFLFLNAQAGNPTFLSPDLHSTISYYGTQATFHMATAQTHARAFKFGLGLQYRITEDLDVFTAINLFSAKPTFLVNVSSNIGNPSIETIIQQMNTTIIKCGLIVKVL